MDVPIDPRTENSPYLGFIYTSFQEHATFVSHENTARHAKEHGDLKLAQICGIIAADEKRHKTAYTKIADILEFLVGRWKVADLTGLSGEGRKAQEYVCGLPPRIRRFEERAAGRAKEGPMMPSFEKLEYADVIFLNLERIVSLRVCKLLWTYYRTCYANFDVDEMSMVIPVFFPAKNDGTIPGTESLPGAGSGTGFC
ncbi:hypothetical protein CTI12_AA488740 [Artemisia annua]|uniref:Uncharacterized protein n=1 Tax=Artemisia annua TaxID=35608 RepID=A0A2U1LGY3_ARTAN|nr:hypothetical protein CTI12_AA488740 [Artemisia annua]